MKNKLLLISTIFALLVLLVPCAYVKASASSMSPAGNANIKVIDISHHNVLQDANGNYLYSSLNWSSLKSSVSAVYIKATEGRTYTDPCFTALTASAQSAGISHGFYHYFWPSADTSISRQQADYFYSVIKSYGYDCVPVLDVEENTDGITSSALSKTQITNAVKAFADEFKSKSGRDIMIYTYNSYIDSYFDSSLSKYKLWVANWSSSGAYDTSVWHSWDMWQYTATSSVSGITGLADCNKATRNIFLNSTSGTTWIDFPSGTDGAGDITVSGWALSYYGIARVDVYVDGKWQGTVSKSDFSQRKDIESKLAGSGYDDALNCGYSYAISDGTLSSGTHKVLVAAVDSRGNAVWSSQKTFAVKVAENNMHLDKPSGTYAGAVTVSGWAISRFGNRRVDVYVDGIGVGSVASSAFTERTDIENLFGSSGYTDLTHSGFSYTIPDGTLSGGTHVIRVASVDNKGRAMWSTQKTFTVKVPSNQLCLDKPSGTYTGDVSVSGWAISNFGIRRVDVYVDGKGMGSVTNGSLTARTDIESIFANKRYYDLAHSGFSYTISDGKLSGGTHQVRVAVIDNKGNVTWSAQKSFTVKVPDDQLHIDSPSGTYSSDIAVSGWAISHYGIRRVDIYVDGNGMGSVLNSVFTERSDIESIFGSSGYNDLTHSGFSYTIPYGKLSSGTHQVRVAAVDNNGNAVWSSLKTFTVY